MTTQDQSRGRFIKLTLLTEREVAALFHVSRDAIRRWARDGRLPRLKIGRCARYRAIDVERIVAQGLPARPIDEDERR